MARTYNNSSDFFVTPSSADNPSQYTIVIHFRPRGFASTWGFNGIGTKTSNLGTTNGYGTFVSSSTLRVAHGASSPYFDLSGTTTALSANPSHPLCVVLAWTGAEIRVYVDGVLKDSGAFTQAIASGNGYFKVMSNRDTSSGEGDVLSSYLFTRALTDEEAVSLSLAPYQIFKPRTARIYSFPSGAGSLNVSATCDALTLAEYAATLSKSLNISAGVDALTLAEYPATIGSVLNVQATADALTLAKYPASIGLSLNIQAGVDALTLTEYAASLGSTHNVDATCDALALAEYAATIGLSLNISAGLDALTLTEYG
ncbi:MAG: hypothetical protein IT323_15935, partial [Anaerolineae bacterium]|nr:hypothetical protein [Anaerolineae bacterium]